MWDSGEVGRWEVSDFIQRWGMQGQPKISYFLFLMLINGTNCRDVFKMLDLLQTVKNIIRCEGVLNS